MKPTEELLNVFAFSHFEKYRDEAMAAFKLSVQFHPDSPGVYNTLGQAYEEGGQMDLAKANFEIAVRNATAALDLALPEMKANLERVSKPKAK